MHAQQTVMVDYSTREKHDKVTISNRAQQTKQGKDVKSRKTQAGKDHNYYILHKQFSEAPVFPEVVLLQDRPSYVF